MSKVVRICFLAVGIMFFQNFCLSHPIKMSTAKLEINDEKQMVTIHFFADDFQEHLSELYRQPIDLSSVNESEKKMIWKYIRERFLVSLNGIQINWYGLSAEALPDNIIEVKLKASKPLKHIEKVEVTDALLIDAFDNQSNIVHVFFYEHKKTFQFVKGDLRGVIDK